MIFMEPKFIRLNKMTLDEIDELRKTHVLAYCKCTTNTDEVIAVPKDGEGGCIHFNCPRCGESLGVVDATNLMPIWPTQEE